MTFIMSGKGETFNTRTQCVHVEKLKKWTTNIFKTGLCRNIKNEKKKKKINASFADGTIWRSVVVLQMLCWVVFQLYSLFRRLIFTAAFKLPAL